MMMETMVPVLSITVTNSHCETNAGVWLIPTETNDCPWAELDIVIVYRIIPCMIFYFINDPGLQMEFTTRIWVESFCRLTVSPEQLVK
jgi:hypothetical protein